MSHLNQHTYCDIQFTLELYLREDAHWHGYAMVELDGVTKQVAAAPSRDKRTAYRNGWLAGRDFIRMTTR